MKKKIILVLSTLFLLTSCQSFLPNNNIQGNKPQTEPELKPDVQPEVKPDTKPDVQPETQPETKPDVQPEVKPDVQPEVKPDVQPEVKPDTKPDVQPETKPEVKPDPQPQPEVDPNKTYTLNIITVNDLHGAIQKNSYSKGIAALKYQIDQIENEDNIKNTIVIGNGDMLQGSALSNISYGKSVINAMNSVGFDILGVGNHEFDWGIEKYLSYFDGNVLNGESSAKLVNTNLYTKDTNKILDHSLPYSVLDLGFVKVGVVSFAPPSIKNSILASRTDNINFRNLDSVTKNSIKECDAKSDIMIANVHDGSGVNDPFNVSLANENIDAIVNGHAHAEYCGLLANNNKMIPVVQNRDSLKSTFGRITLTIKNKQIIDQKVENVLLGTNEDKKVNEVVNNEYSIYKTQIEENLCTPYKSYSSKDKTSFNKWGVNLINAVTKSDISLINNGAFRNISLSGSKPIQYGDVYSLMPFDNEIVVFNLTGKEIKAIPYSSAVWSSDVTLLDDNKTYKIAIIDYVAYKFSSLRDLVKKNQATVYPVNFRLLICDEFREHGKQNIKFNVKTTKFLSAK